MKLAKTIFIALEGGEGVGKSTQIEYLKTTLQQNNYSVVVTREPGGIKSAEEIRSIIFNNNITNITELLLFTASRHENIVNNITPNLGKVDFIITDRFILSTLIYQGYVGGYSIELIKQLHRLTNDDLYPDFTIILDINPKIALKRIARSKDLNKFDNKGVDYHKQIALGYQSYKNFYPATTVVIGSSTEDLLYPTSDLSPAYTYNEIINSINKQFALNIKKTTIFNEQ